MHPLRLSLAAVLIALAASARAEPALRYDCYRSAVAPTLDGVVTGDPGWAGIPAASGFHRLGAGYTVAKQTVAYATWDDASLYMAIVAEEPDVARLKPQASDGGFCWTDDGVELWIQPPGRGPLQFGVTAEGARCTGEGDLGLGGWEAKASHTDTAYSLEVRFSFALLGATPADGDVWHGNFCRNVFATDSGGDKYTTWAPLAARFLEPERFPPLQFHAGTLTPQAAREVEAGLNASYRDSLLAGLKALEAEAPEYAPILDQAARDPRYSAAAAPLKAAWDAVLALQRDATTASLADVRSILSRAEQLSADSYALKYRVLLDQLFE